MKNITQLLKVISLALILSFGLSYVYAWTAPTVSPPGGNVEAPVNTSATSQYKAGALGIGGIIHGYSNAYFDGNVGIGTTAPAQKLSVAGTIESTSGGIKFPDATVQTTAAAGPSGTLVNMYQCPGLVSLGGGAWGYYGCQSQIQNQPSCLEIEWPTWKTFTCTYVGKMRLEP